MTVLYPLVMLQVMYVNTPNYEVVSKRFPGRCENVVHSLHIQILHASIGRQKVSTYCCTYSYSLLDR